MSDEPTAPAGYPADRAKSFVDAVVSIAMTLLILPLLDSVGDAGRRGWDTARWFAEENGSIFLFVTSFAVIAMFWLLHHRLFARVHRVSGGLLWLLMAWLLTIVWLPVATAMTGAFDGPLQKAVYIGSMVSTCLITVAIRLFLRTHPALDDIPDRDIRAGLAVDLSMTTLFLAAMAVSIAVPAIGYSALFLLVLTPLVERGYDRMLGVGPA